MTGLSGGISGGTSEGSRPPAPPRLEVRELRYFQAVAEELNFSAAARRLGIAQPPLSRAISQLERRLGVRLLNRDHHRVELTEAGATLLEEARGVLDAVSAAARRTQQAARTAPRLVITAKPGAATVLPQLVEAYRAAAGPRGEPAEVEVLVSGHGEQVDLVRTGRADAALIGPPHQHSGLVAEPLLAEPRVAALPAGHPLAQRDSLHCADLAGYPIPQRPGASPEARAYWTGQDRIAAAGGVPDLPPGPAVQDHAQLLEVVALGQAVALVPESLAARSQRPDIAYRPVTDASPYTIALIWPAQVRNRWLAQFVRAAAEYAASQHGTLLGELATTQLWLGRTASGVSRPASCLSAYTRFAEVVTWKIWALRKIGRRFWRHSFHRVLIFRKTPTSPSVSGRYAPRSELDARVVQRRRDSRPAATGPVNAGKCPRSWFPG